MPVIEQAKGIVMGQQWCGPEEAFELLRRASQRINVKVHVLTAQIVEQVASGGNASNVTPISLGAMRYQQSRARSGDGPVSAPAVGEFLADVE
jgi:ANTAR domain